MRRISLLSSFFIVCFAIAVQAQTAAPKPYPELQKLHPYIGHWTYEGEYKPGPLGPGAKFTGEYESKMILGGFLYQAHFTEQGASGVAKGLEIDGYDPVNKNIFAGWYTDDGGRFSGVMSVSGNTLDFSGKATLAGKEYLARVTFVLAADQMSATFKGDISTDGKTWVPFEEGKWTKVKPEKK